MTTAPLTNEARARLIATKLANGELRADAPSTVFKNLGSGHVCTACVRVIDSTNIQAECLWIGVTYRFHVECHAEWERQRAWR